MRLRVKGPTESQDSFALRGQRNPGRAEETISEHFTEGKGSLSRILQYGSTANTGSYGLAGVERLTRSPIVTYCLTNDVTSKTGPPRAKRVRRW